MFLPKNTSKYKTDHHGWSEFLPARESKPSLTGDVRTSWLIIGAGLTGLSAARTLATLNPNDQIVLVEAREVGQGASGRNSGYAVKYSQFPGAFDNGLISEYKRVNRINQAGLSLLRTSVLDNDIQCSWHEDGFHHAAADAMSLHECDHYQHYLQSLDIAHTALSHNELSERLGSSVYKRGFHVHDGALLQPAALVRGLVDTLPNNVTLYESSPVLKLAYGKRLL